MFKTDIKLVSQKEVAEVLGTSVAVLNTLRSRGTIDIPYYKIGRKVAYNMADVQKWLEEKGRRTCRRKSTR